MASHPLRITSPQPDPPAADLWQCGTDIVPIETRWILPGRLTAGSLAIVEGDTDVGKSVFLAHLAAAITSGKPFLGRPKSAPAGVLWLTSEEDHGEHLLPRLSAVGANLAHFHAPQLDEYKQRHRYLLPGCIGAFRAAIELLGLSLIILEPLPSHVDPDVKLNDTASCRAALDPLNALALATGCTVIVTRGFRKSRLGPRTGWGEGSNTIGATARVILQVEKVEDDPDERTIRTVKCKGARSTPLLRYRLLKEKGGIVMTDLRDVGMGEDQDDQVSLDPGDRDAKVEAVDLLRSVIGEEWIAVRKIIDAGVEAGLMIGVLRRAKAKLKVRHRRVGFGPDSRPEWGPPAGGWTAPEGGGARNVAPMASMEKPVKKSRRKSIDT